MILCALAITGWMYGRNQLQTTYAGDSPDGVTLVWADQFRYCIEATGWFVQGPGGTPAGGSCPR